MIIYYLVAVSCLVAISALFLNLAIQSSRSYDNDNFPMVRNIILIDLTISVIVSNCSMLKLVIEDTILCFYFSKKYARYGF